MNRAARTFVAGLTAGLLVVPYQHCAAQHSSGHGTSPPTVESQYTTSTTYDGTDEKIRNSMLFTHRDGMDRRDGILDVSKHEGVWGAMGAGRYDHRIGSTYDLQFRGFGGKPDIDHGEYFAGAHVRAGHRLSPKLRIRARAGHEQTDLEKDNKREDLRTTFGYGEFTAADMPLEGRKEKTKSIEVLAGMGHLRGTKTSEHGVENVNRHPYGFQVIATRGNYGAGIGLTQPDNSMGDITYNVAVFRYASYSKNKLPTGFLFLRDTPGTSLSILGLYWGPGIDGSWQLVEPAVRGMTQGMWYRTIAHPNQDVGSVARFNEIGTGFSRDFEDGTIVLVGANFQQQAGPGMIVAERELGAHGTLHRTYGPLSNMHIGCARGETVEPLRPMSNDTDKYTSLTFSTDMFGTYFEKRGMRLGVFSELTFRKAGTENTCGLYLSGVKGLGFLKDLF